MARALTFFCTVLLTAVASVAARQPNVVLIFADDMGYFFECVKSRDLPISDAFSHHRAVSILHLANLCLQLGRKLTWDLATEQIVGDGVANAMQSREQHKGFEIFA